MNKIINCDINLLLNKIRQTPIDKLVFWVGAGIDIPFPTALPSGKDLLRFFLENTCGMDATDKLFKIWRTNELIITQSVSDNFSSIPRLETVLDELLTCEQHLKEPRSFFSGLSSFSEAPPNRNHYILANLLSKGANVVTTNFDMCLQKAFTHLNSGDEYLLDLSSSMPIYCNNKPNYGKIYHVHGIANNLATLGATLRQLKQGLPENFIKVLNSWMQNQCLFIFLGYSGSDSLDVNRYFISKENEVCGSTGIFVRHTTEKIINNKVFEKEAKLLSAFERKYVIQENTTYLLETLFSIPIYPASTMLEFQWEKSFMKNAEKLPKSANKTFLTSLCGILGINIEKIISEKDWINFADDQEIFDEWYATYACYRMASIQGNAYLINFYMDRLQIKNKTYYLNLESIERGGGVLLEEKYLDECQNLYNEINKLIKEKSIITWDISSPINLMCKILINLILKNSPEYVKTNYSNNIKTIMQCLEALLHLDYNSFLEIHQVCSGERYYAVLSALMEERLEQALILFKQSTYYYAEIGRIDGILGNLLFLSLVHVMQDFYDRSYQHLEEVKKLIKIIKLLIDSNGYYRYIPTLENMIDFCKKNYEKELKNENSCGYSYI